MDDVSKGDFLIILRAFQSGVLEHTATQAGKRFAQLGFGRIQGRRWLWQPIDRTRIRDYLINACGIAEPETYEADFKERGRIQTAEIIAEEKFAGRKPRAGRVLLRSPLYRIQINGDTFPHTRGGVHDIPVTDIQSIEHDAVIAVENFEAFAHFEMFQLQDMPFANPLILYRGDSINFPDASKKLLADSTLPVYAFTDFDPHGLNIAASLPRIQGALFPSALDALNRGDLYIRQLVFLGVPDKYPQSWHDSIDAMVDARCCMTQEHMAAFGIPIFCLPVNPNNLVLAASTISLALAKSNP